MSRSLPAIPLIDVRHGGPVAHAQRSRDAMLDLRAACFSVLPAPTLTNLPSGWPYDLVGQMVAVRAATPAASPPTSG